MSMLSWLFDGDWTLAFSRLLVHNSAYNTYLVLVLCMAMYANHGGFRYTLMITVAHCAALIAMGWNLNLKVELILSTVNAGLMRELSKFRFDLDLPDVVLGPRATASSCIYLLSLLETIICMFVPKPSDPMRIDEAEPGALHHREHDAVPDVYRCREA
ncbi:hypothetical protein CALVIDRAFT_542266 [Calocera viscosa TUFC12733]|uniref:Uncharacterized protein n=1 Tax=Calocera viscosa (strain TUFC12733) TaxID=1330018 RepID=A0A167GTN5_CALVF|nr:hypothetical protein CALVIDRAFT_542266 [Calocera viscosa TUFC12733]